VVDDRDAGGEAVGFLEVLGGEQNGHAVARELGHDPPQLLARPGVQSGGRLVEQDDRRAADEARGEVQPSAHAARVDGGAAVGGLGELEALQQLARAGSRLGARQPVQPADHLQVLAAGELAVDRRELAGQADLAPHREGLPDHVVAEHAGLARRRLEQRGEDADQRGLARPVGPEQPEHHPRGDVELEAVERVHLAELLAQVTRLDR